LLDSVVRGEETWCFQYDPQTKRQSMEWILKASRHKKFWFQKSKNRDVNHTLWKSGNHSQRICSTRSDSEWGIIDGSIVSFGSKNLLVRPQFQEKGSWFLLHDNVRPHCSINKAVFGKTRDSRTKSPPPFSWSLPTTLFLIPQNQIHSTREKNWRHRGH
jgi:hypothetical protein